MLQVQGTLSGGSKVAWQIAGCRGQVQNTSQVPFAKDYLGRRRNYLLLQREESPGTQGLLSPEPLPHAGRKANAGEAHRPDTDTGKVFFFQFLIFWLKKSFIFL